MALCQEQQDDEGGREQRDSEPHEIENDAHGGEAGRDYLTYLRQIQLDGVRCVAGLRRPCGGAWLDCSLTALDHLAEMSDYELIAQQVSSLAEKIDALTRRVDEVEKVNARLEAAALTTARSMEEIATHWDAVYEAMRRREPEAERDN